MSDQKLYDVIVVGGGPMGLSSAYHCAVKEGKKVLLIEQFEKFGNDYGSSPGFGRQFRTCYSERNLCELAIKTSGLWNEFMEEFNNNTLLDRTGCLWFGDSSVHTSEGNIDEAVVNLKALGQDYELIEGKQNIQNDPRFSFIYGAVSDVDAPKALYLKDGGTINVPALVQCLVKALEDSMKADLVSSELVTCIDYRSGNEVRVLTNRARQYCSKKVILTVGTYINNVLSTLTPVFTQRINLVIYLWSSTYFKVKSVPIRSSAPPAGSDTSKWPVWYFFGRPKPTGDNEPHDLNSYYGFPSEQLRPSYARVAPAFTSKSNFDYWDYPPLIPDRQLDTDALKFTSEFVKKSMSDLNSSLIPAQCSTCVAGFAESKRPLEPLEKEDSEDKKDSSAGFVLDFLPGPHINNRIVLLTGGWGMKYVPIMGKILADLVIKGETEYGKLIEPMNIKRGVLIEEAELLERKKIATAQT